MAKLDASKKLRKEIMSGVRDFIKEVQPDVDNRKSAYKMRRDMFEGKHHLYTNVVGQGNKEQEGHVLPVFNYVSKIGRSLQRIISGSGFRFRIDPQDQLSEIESVRAETVESWLTRVLYRNKFMKSTLKRGALVQVRDGDFGLKCVVEGEGEDKEIKIHHVEDMEKLYVLWDDASGSSFSKIAYVDLWSLDKIEREFPGIDINDLPSPRKDEKSSTQGDHGGDQYGTQYVGGTSGNDLAPSYLGKNAKYRIVDYWGWEKDKDKELIVSNMILIGEGSEAYIAQYDETDYSKLPWFIGHSEANPGKPWSSAFIDSLFDANIEINDRTGEEADFIRAGSNLKYIAKNMQDFDADSIKKSKQQVIYIEGEDADLYPLGIPVNIFPSESYKNSALDHIFNLGLPKVALASGPAPNTGRAGAVQYQPIADIVGDFRDAWDVVLQDLFDLIQEYGIRYFDELADMFTESISIGEGKSEDGSMIVRDVHFDWDNPVPLSRSDKVIDAATLFDRKVLPTKVLLQEAGFEDTNRIMKEVEQEFKDQDMVPIRTRFEEFSEGVLKAQNEARKAQLGTEEAMLAAATGGTQPNPLMPGGEERRGVSSSKGVPTTGQAATTGGSNRQVQQNLNAKRGS